MLRSTNSRVLLKKHIKHSEPDTTLSEFIAARICLGDDSLLDQSSIAEVLIGKSFTETNMDNETIPSLNMEEVRSIYPKP